LSTTHSEMDTVALGLTFPFVVLHAGHPIDDYFVFYRVLSNFRDIILFSMTADVVATSLYGLVVSMFV